MPLYEYRCQSCRKSFEVLQRLGEDPEGLICPSCGGGALTKQHSTFASPGGGSSRRESAAAGGPPGCASGFT